MANKTLNSKYLIFILAVVTFILTLVFNKYPNLTQTAYTDFIYKGIAVSLSYYSSIFPFSLSDVTYILILLLLLVLIYVIIFRKKNLKQILAIFFKSLLLLYISFYWLWGFNYYKNDIYQQKILVESEINDSMFISTLNDLINRTNSLQTSLDNFCIIEANNLIEKSYENNANLLKLNYPLGIRQPKNIIASSYFSAASIFGYFGPFYNEIHLNESLLPIQYPVVLAHEKAHQFGITNEAEANFIAWYICNNSSSKKIMYSGNLYLLYYYIKQLKNKNITYDVNNRMSERVKIDLNNIKKHWKALRIESIDDLNSWFYNYYLKINRIPEGVKSYNGVVKMYCDYINNK